MCVSGQAQRAGTHGHGAACHGRAPTLPAHRFYQCARQASFTDRIGSAPGRRRSFSLTPSYASYVSAISQLDGPCGVPGRMQIGRGERGSPHSTMSVSTGLWLCALATKRKITTKICTNFSPTSEKSEEEEETETSTRYVFWWFEPQNHTGERFLGLDGQRISRKRR